VDQQQNQMQQTYYANQQPLSPNNALKGGWMVVYNYRFYAILQFCVSYYRSNRQMEVREDDQKGLFYRLSLATVRTYPLR
jgi:hypothetical protein